MRVSEISAWSECEAMALLHSPPRQAGRTNIAAWVGTLAHAELSKTIIVEAPGRIAYDSLTPTSRHTLIQAKAIATKARELLTDQGWGVIGARRNYGATN